MKLNNELNYFMSEIAQITDNLEKKVSLLFEKMNDLEQRNKMLINELALSIKSNQQQNGIFLKLKSDFETLKITNSLLGSDDYKRDTKLKINSLIREIDYCIAQLSD